MPTGIIRAPATPVVAAEPATARPLVVELSMSVFTHPSIVPKCVCLSVVCCLIMWCMRCDWFKSRRKAESKPLLSCGDGSDPWEAEDLIVQIGIPAREFVRISTIPPCSGVWKGPIELRACPQSPGGAGGGWHAAVSLLARFGLPRTPTQRLVHPTPPTALCLDAPFEVRPTTASFRHHAGCSPSRASGDAWRVATWARAPSPHTRPKAYLNSAASRLLNGSSTSPWSRLEPEAHNRPVPHGWVRSGLW